MRIVSLLPSATEICFALGLGDHLVGVTHECDYPPETSRKPKVTRSEANEHLSSSAIDALVRSQLDETGSIYQLDTVILEELQPDVILTQRLCTVCAVSFDYVKEQAKHLSSSPRVINLEPRTLDEVLESIILIGSLCGHRDDAAAYTEELRSRISSVKDRVRPFEKKSVLFLEWIDPPFAAGHWIPELIEIAGGSNTLAFKHFPSRQVTWEQINAQQAEIIVAAECGFTIERQQRDVPMLIENLTYTPEEIWLADGSQYFSRPGPRLVDSIEILAGILHPEIRKEYHKGFLHRKEIEQIVLPEFVSDQ